MAVHKQKGKILNIKLFAAIIFMAIITTPTFCLKIHQTASEWDSYIDNLIAQSNGSADKASIISLDGGASWTSNDAPNSLKLSPVEGQKIAQALKSGDFTSMQANGIVVEGKKYQFLRQDGKVAFGKAKGIGALTIQRSKSAVVIGHTKEGAQQGNTNKAVAIIADYLESVGM